MTISIQALVSDLDSIQGERLVHLRSVYLKGIFDTEKKDAQSFGAFLLQKDEQSNSFLSLVEKYGDETFFKEVVEEAIKYPAIFSGEHNLISQKFVDILVANLNFTVSSFLSSSYYAKALQTKLHALVTIAFNFPQYKDQIINELITKKDQYEIEKDDVVFTGSLIHMIIVIGAQDLFYELKAFNDAEVFKRLFSARSAKDWTPLMSAARLHTFFVDQIIKLVGRQSEGFYELEGRGANKGGGVTVLHIAAGSCLDKIVLILDALGVDGAKRLTNIKTEKTNQTYQDIAAKVLPRYLNQKLTETPRDQKAIQNLMKLLVIIINERPDLAENLIEELFKYTYANSNSDLPALSFVQKLIMDKDEASLAELEKITDKKMVMKLLASTSTDPKRNWNALYTALQYFPEYVERLLNLAGDHASELCAAKCKSVTNISGEETILFAATTNKEKIKEIPTLLKALGANRLAIASAKNYIGQTFLHNIARENYDCMIIVLRALGADAAAVCGITDKIFQSPLALVRGHNINLNRLGAEREIIIATGEFKEIDSNSLPDAITTYLTYYFSPLTSNSLIKAFDKLGREKTQYLKSVRLLVDQLSSNITNNQALYKSLVTEFLSFLANPEIKFSEEKDTKGMKELMAVLLDNKAVNTPNFYKNVIKVLEARLGRHGEVGTKVFNNSSRDSNRDVNLFFDRFTRLLLEIKEESSKEEKPKKEKLLDSKVYFAVHPCGVAYHFIFEQMKEKPEKADDIKAWFIKLVTAKVNNQDTSKLIFNRPRMNWNDVSWFNKEGEKSRAVFENFCAASDTEMAEFWTALESEEGTEHADFIGKLKALKPDEKVGTHKGEFKENGSSSGGENEKVGSMYNSGL